ncbi:MAG: hypothetical protein HRT45_00360 [Bdellovibrionales bacterium]|nr:hypothetical protein [Bdellovibrionales bacterium]
MKKIYLGRADCLKMEAKDRRASARLRLRQPVLFHNTSTQNSFLGQTYEVGKESFTVVVPSALRSLEGAHYLEFTGSGVFGNGLVKATVVRTHLVNGNTFVTFRLGDSNGRLKDKLSKLINKQTGSAQ